uniref:Uncharacterized protein n=1 Tax=Zonotrichia albicollis TaxID=44394 RepID=A0A8D2QAU2_ZONAL
MFSNNDEAVPTDLFYLFIFIFCFILTTHLRFFPLIKAWNVLALDGSNWQRIDLPNCPGRGVCAALLEQLALPVCHGAPAWPQTFAQNCRNIEVLNLNGCTKITDA